MITHSDLSTVRCTVDPVGRVQIPKPIRDKLGIRPGSLVEMQFNGAQTYLIRPVNPMRCCALCGAVTDSPLTIRAQIVCAQCMAQLQALQAGERQRPK